MFKKIKLLASFGTLSISTALTACIGNDKDTVKSEADTAKENLDWIVKENDKYSSESPIFVEKYDSTARIREIWNGLIAETITFTTEIFDELIGLIFNRKDKPIAGAASEIESIKIFSQVYKPKNPFLLGELDMGLRGMTVLLTWKDAKRGPVNLTFNLFTYTEDEIGEFIFDLFRNRSFMKTITSSTIPGGAFKSAYAQKHEEIFNSINSGVTTTIDSNLQIENKNFYDAMINNFYESHLKANLKTWQSNQTQQSETYQNLIKDLTNIAPLTNPDAVFGFSKKEVYDLINKDSVKKSVNISNWSAIKPDASNSEILKPKILGNASFFSSTGLSSDINDYWINGMKTGSKIQVGNYSGNSTNLVLVSLVELKAGSFVKNVFVSYIINSIIPL